MAGKKGKRYILPNAKVMIHQPFGGVYGQAADIEIQAEEILKNKDTLINIMSRVHRPADGKVRRTASATGSSTPRRPSSTASATK